MNMLLHKIRERLTKPYHLELQDNILARIKSGQLTEETELSTALDVLKMDSLDIVNLEGMIEEEGSDAVPIKTVGDLLWLLKAIEFRLQRKSRLGS